jgi:dTDP-4-amino-4,6-dideoxygalactose transaminase
MSKQLDKIWLSSPHMGGNEKKYVLDAIQSNWISPLGPYVTKMESDLAKYIKCDDVALLNSGTAAIHLALKLLEVAQGDIVLCQSMTFSASANPILYEKAIPVFIDSEEETWNICPLAAEEAIKKYISLNKKPKAIIVVHLYGMPAKMEELTKLSNKYEIPIIEDAAEALGSNINNKMCGSFSEFGVLSFNGNKIITTSGGGALLSNNVLAIQKARFLASQAKDPAPHYEHSAIGYNYRLSNISAAIGVGQLEVLNNRVLARRANFDFYKDNLSSIEGIKFNMEPEGFYSNRWLSCITLDSNKFSPDQLRLGLEKQNIESRPLWKPMHLQPIFREFDFIGGSVSENLFNKGLCLPSGSNLNNIDRERVLKTIKSLL